MPKKKQGKDPDEAIALAHIRDQMLSLNMKFSVMTDNPFLTEISHLEAVYYHRQAELDKLGHILSEAKATQVYQRLQKQQAQEPEVPEWQT
jgi:hypothetical protein